MVIRLHLCAALVALLTPTARAIDLYEVSLYDERQAVQLRQSEAHPIVRVGNDYIVLAEREVIDGLNASGIATRLIAVNVNPDELALDRRRGPHRVAPYPVVYAAGPVRLLRAPVSDLVRSEVKADYLSVKDLLPKVQYTTPQAASAVPGVTPVDLDSLIGLIRQDSVESYVHHLQAFDGRVAGSLSGYAARDWILSQFQSFGYPMAFLDDFAAEVDEDTKTCYNVVAAKLGSRYPDVQIVVGAHYDGVPGSPAADDNSTGTAAVLEIARALRDVETEVTFVFIAFDAEETGLDGSRHYAVEADARNDPILLMVNLDMLGFLPNSDSAVVSDGGTRRFAQLWSDLAQPLVGITGVVEDVYATSDHWPFFERGFSVLDLIEYEFSDVIHTPRDSTTYINFDYATRMIQATLATVYTAGTIDDSGDLDGDTQPNGTDNCVLTSNWKQEDEDEDGRGDACDNCPSDPNPDQTDTDFDFLGDICDVCPLHRENDVDGDGVCPDVDNCPDLSNPGQDDGNANGIGDACECTGPNCVLFGAGTGHRFGFSVSSAGDFNNDGYDDVIVGRDGFELGGSTPGAAYVYSGIDGQPLLTCTGEANGDWFGCAVDGIGDVNNDGYDDVIVGAACNDASSFNAGRAYVLLGRAGSVPDTVAGGDAHFIFTGTAMADYLGISVAGVGDCDNDSVGDILVGAMQYELGGPGKACLYSGRTGALLHVFTGEVSGDHFGNAVADAGDVNGDDVADLIIGAPYHDALGLSTGRAYVFSGLDLSLLRRMTGIIKWEYFGSAVAGIGDMDGDGYDDVAVGAPYYGNIGPYIESDKGRVQIHSGLTGSLLREHRGATDTTRLGMSVAGVGDVNGDGRDDYAVGIPGESRVLLYSGADGAVLNSSRGTAGGEEYGIDVAAQGDLNDDGINDLIVGAPWNDEYGSNSGSAYVYYLGDVDGDIFTAGCDNCPATYNPTQADYDDDGIGDACAPCYCPCHGDPQCDGSTDVLDVVLTVDVAFRGQEPTSGPVCPLDQTDVDCDGFTSVLDVVHVVNVAFRNGDPAAEFCDACAE